ncbi:type II toxin-antitoxin system tRNA(fMet)-specific endonuclease VapC [Paralysiella testudinis]
MLDTNICIYTMKNKPEEVRQAFNLHHTQMCISSVVLMELVFGAEKSARAQEAFAAVEGFAARMMVLDFDEAAAYHTGQIRAELKKAGKPIGSYDCMIAGHARSRGLIVVSNNLREFDCISGLRTENWVAAQ